MKTKWAKQGLLPVEDKLLKPKLSTDALELLYGMAYSHVQRKNYKDGAALFRLLTVYDPGCQAYWIGLGMAEQGNQDPRAALESYAKAAPLGIENAHVHLKAAECHFALKNTEKARDALTCAEQALKIEPQEGLLKQVQLLRSIWR